MTEMAKMIDRVRRFFRDNPDLNRSLFAARAKLHRNSLYGFNDKGWNPRVETLDKLLRAIDAYQAEEAKAQRKPRPSKLAMAAEAA